MLRKSVFWSTTARGWSVTDTRFCNRYDAVARCLGEAIFLKDKGTATVGAAVRVTSGEVEHAPRNRVSAAWAFCQRSRWDVEGHVDSNSGTLRILPFEPKTTNSS